MMEIRFSSIYNILLYFPVWIIGVTFLISTIVVLCSWITKIFKFKRRIFSKFIITFATLTVTIGLSFFYSIHSYHSSGLEKPNNSLNQDNNKEELQNSALQKSQEHEIKNEKISASLKHEHIIKEIENAAIEKSKEYEQRTKIAKAEDLPSPDFWYLTLIFLEKYLLNAFLSLSVLGVLISYFYKWLVTEYRRFNDSYVEYSSQYKALILSEPKTEEDIYTNEHQKKLYLRKISYLLQEEYTMFFEMNMAYSQFKFGYIFKPYFYILNICYACGLDLYIDVWHHAFHKIARTNKASLQKDIDEKIDITRDADKAMHYQINYLIEENEKQRNKLNTNPNPYYDFIFKLSNIKDLKEI